LIINRQAKQKQKQKQKQQRDKDTNKTNKKRIDNLSTNNKTKMPLESCMIIVDNSEFMRNGDYIPTRLEAQQDAANLLVGAKTQSHPESTVGIAAGTELLVSPTEDVGKLLGAVHDLQISRKGASFGIVSVSSSEAASSQKMGKKKDSADVTAAIQVASLALKHRKNKNGSQRIVLFIGSPLEGIDGRTLAKAGRQLKKNNVSIDVVAMGEIEDNEEKLKELVDAANGRVASEGEGAERSCHLVTIPAGVLPSDVLASSPIVHGGSGGSAFAASAAAAAAGAGGDFGSSGGGGGGANDFADFGGVDPNMDPELAMALRVSMEEERARQERMAEAARTEAAEEGKDAEMSNVGASGEAAEGAAPSAMDLGLSEEEALLQQALAMSMSENDPQSAAAAEDSKPAASMETEDDDDDEAAAMQLALQMSLAQAEEEKGSKEEGKPNQQFQDPQFVNQLLGSLPGVNPNDPAIQSALQNMKKDDDEDKKDDDKKE
jgi:26S proteasome regulatory subunit N10